jgi:hypothetical protein
MHLQCPLVKIGQGLTGDSPVARGLTGSLRAGLQTCRKRSVRQTGNRA